MHKCTKSKHPRLRRHVVFGFWSGRAIAHPHSGKGGELAWKAKAIPDILEPTCFDPINTYQSTRRQKEKLSIHTAEGRKVAWRFAIPTEYLGK